MITIRKIKELYKGSTTQDEIISDQTRDENILISFLFSTKIIILIFILVNYLGHRPYSTIADLIFLIILLLISLYYRFTGQVQKAYFAFITSLILLVSVQHFIADTKLYSNIIWLPVFIFVSHSFLKTKLHWPITLIGIVFFEIAILKHYLYPNLMLEQSAQLDALITNLITILLAGIGTYIASKSIIGQDLAIKQQLETQKNSFRQLNYNNAALSSMITHDIATPLTLAIAYIRQIPPSDPQKKIQHALNQIAEIIHNARQLRAMNAGKLKISLHDVDIIEVIIEVISNFENQAKKKNISIIPSLPNGPIYVRAEKNSLYTSVLNNLITNAIKFSHPNSKIDVSIEERNKCIILQIKDYGIGIPPHLHSKIFDFTEQTTRKGTSGEEGTGFGLPLVKLFCDIYNCSISIESAYNAGTTFSLKFKKGEQHDPRSS